MIASLETKILFLKKLLQFFVILGVSREQKNPSERI